MLSKAALVHCNRGYKNKDVGMNWKRRTIKRTFLCCDYYTWLVISSSFFLLTPTLCVFLEVASELFFKKVAYFLKNFQIVPVERCEACSGKKLAICIFSLQTKNVFWILDFPLSFQWQREKKGIGMANDRGQEEERGRTLEEVTVNRTGKRLVEGMGRAAVVGFHVHQCHPSVTPPAVPGWCWDQLGDNQLV